MKVTKILSMKEKDYLLFLLLSSFIIRLLYMLVAGNFENPEMYEHGMIARNLLDGYGFSMHWPYPAISGHMVEIQKLPPKYEGAFIPPLNPYLIYLSFEIFGDNSVSYFILMFVNVVFSSFFVVIIYFIAKEFTDEQKSRISALVSMLFLPSIVAITTFSGTALYQLLAGLVLFLSIKAYKTGNIKNFVLLGIFSGLLTLVRSEYLAFNFIVLGTILIISLIRNKKEIKKIVVNVCIASIVFSIIVSPWIIRNTLLFDKFTTIVSHPWHEIWRGNNEHSSGGASSIYQLNIWVRKHQYPEIIKKIDKIPYNQQFELAVDNVFREEVIKFWSENPIKTLTIWLKRTLFTLSIDPYTPRARNPLYIFFVLISVITFIFGIKWVVKNRQKGDLSYWIYLAFLLSYLALVTSVNLETRYQVYLVSIIHPFFGIGIVELWNRIKQRNYQFITFKGIVFYLFLIIFFVFLILLYIDKEKEYRNFKQFEAIEIKDRIERFYPNEEKVRIKFFKNDNWFEFHPGYINDEVNHPFLKTAKIGDSVFKESKAELLYLLSGEKKYQYRYLIIYNK